MENTEDLFKSSLEIARKRIGDVITKREFEKIFRLQNSFLSLFRMNVLCPYKPLEVYFFTEFSENKTINTDIFEFHAAVFYFVKKMGLENHFSVISICHNEVVRQTYFLSEESGQNENNTIFENPEKLFTDSSKTKECGSTYQILKTEIEKLRNEPIKCGNSLIFVECSKLRSVERENIYAVRGFRNLYFLGAENEEQQHPDDIFRVPPVVLQYFVNTNYNVPFTYSSENVVVTIPQVSPLPLFFPSKTVEYPVEIIKEKGQMYFEVSGDKRRRADIIGTGSYDEVMDFYEAQRIIEELVKKFNARCAQCGFSNHHVEMVPPVVLSDNDKNGYCRAIALREAKDVVNLEDNQIIQTFMHFVFLASEETLKIIAIRGIIAGSPIITDVVLKSTGVAKFYFWKRDLEMGIKHTCNCFCHALGLFKIKLTRPDTVFN
ncbi:hypothetical protein EIN_171550 [Entamoeba invadens IP1]|uniref:Alpha-type protein kinase domain-containing protein n=1 Tax=Entamoeba invadens IP1 TaxID=370355 RepID=A0A0A1TYF2_ENTIV|nr:hypothetical protein EIN_171550 [Entamoeba invadens IP1]ELP84580.1 hypothetical protein EIN_171550 [Entamoeba invadens IP1]|eukprot:XP_004183926.1 hypothetical protein EIN_171550 [Entamoeba invadens IP1]